MEKEVLIEQFPDDEILFYEDFFCQSILSFYEHNQDHIMQCFNVISVPWTKIIWSNFNDIALQGWGGIFSLSETSYKHVFPSLLYELTTRNQRTSLLLDNFVERHLDMRSVAFREWEFEFILSLNKKQFELICSILRESKSKNNPSLIEAAIESYWH